MAAVEKLTVSLEVSPEIEADLKHMADQIANDLAAQMARGLEARIRSIVFNAMRERDVRVVRR